jgi:sporulation protein YlmC with PRC-barrel domain
MISKTIAAALLTTALMTGVASAQTATANKDAATTASMHRDGDWRASKLAGVNVYNEANEKIGDINDVILDKSGKAEKVILGVGGFLGMGEHLVAVPFDKIKWVNEPVRSASTSTAPANAPATNVDSNARTAADGTVRTTTGTATTTPTTTPPTRGASQNWYPDHAVYNATKDQLKAMPEFKY